MNRRLNQVMQALAEMDPDNNTTEQERLEVAELLFADLNNTERLQNAEVQARTERQSRR